ncbi:hypothetical protein B5808_04060 [Cnuibacter physcomitrellae]|uniref:Potassium-transporting ATPase subunit F n=1 Tax=Cnuibacter physcomitrellae TaxID=1619308 RepID=A0A1X9LKN4_9MICO|nr:hypothetical protein B5808_04060 [Cnuibacter physcomitrellae]
MHTRAVCGWSRRRVGPGVCAGDRRPLRRRRPGGLGGREAVIVLETIAAVLGVAAVAYLVVALVKPERF